LQIFKSGTKVFFAKSFNSVIEFAAIIYFASALSPEIIGTFFLFQALLRIISIFADLGVDDGIEKRMSEGEDIPYHLSAGLLLKAISLSTVCLIVLVLGGLIDTYLGARLAVFLVLGIVLYQAHSTAIKVLNGEHRVGETAILRLMQKSTWFAGGSLLILEGYGLNGLVYSLLAGYLFSSILGWARVSTELRKPSIAHIQSIIDYSKYQIISRIGGKVYSWVDILVIGYFLSQAAVGQYEIAWRIASVVVLFSTSLSASILPKVSHWYKNGETEQIEKILPTMITFSMVPVIPAFFGTLLYSQEVLHYLFGPEYTSVWFILIVLMSYKPIQAIQSVIGPALLGIDKPDLAVRATVVSVFTNLVLNVLLVWQFGLIGAASATVVASIVSDGLMYRYLSQYVSVTLEIKMIAWSIFSSTTMVLVLLALNTFVHIQDIQTLLLAVLTGTAVYTATMVAYTPFKTHLTQTYLNI